MHWGIVLASILLLVDNQGLYVPAAEADQRWGVSVLGSLLKPELSPGDLRRVFVREQTRPYRQKENAGWPGKELEVMGTIIALISLLILTGCHKQSSQGTANDNDSAPVTGRGSGQGGDSGGNGKVYDRGGPPGSLKPGNQKPGSGRVDRGGGVTAGGRVDVSEPVNSPAGPTNAPSKQP